MLKFDNTLIKVNGNAHYVFLFKRKHKPGIRNICQIILFCTIIFFYSVNTFASVQVNEPTLLQATNGHYYEFIPAPGITWSEARDAAAKRTYKGFAGYLVTITSSAENDFILKNTGAWSFAWMGASDAEDEGKWSWVTGPICEQKQFSLQNLGSTGVSVDGQYVNWADSEPNDALSTNEDYANIYGVLTGLDELKSGKWNDLPNEFEHIEGYIVEYGGLEVVTAPIITTLTGPTAPIQLGGSATLSAAFSDSDNNIQSATWNWGNGVELNSIITSSPATSTYIYPQPGVYTVTLTLTDHCGQTAIKTYEYVVVYDSNGGFVTGGGFINSPAGALRAQPELQGKANFGFVAKYQKGAATGNTVFQFHAGDFTFKSTSYEETRLVIAGNKANYKGKGTINGTGTYGFMVSAVDGQYNGAANPDRFRIKIWELIASGSEGAVVYDNLVGTEDENAELSLPQFKEATILGGGSIVIHNTTKKSARESSEYASASAEQVEFSAYPNPIIDKVTIDLKGVSAAGTQTILTDAVGKSVLQNAHKVIGDSLLEFDVTSLQPGLYLIQLSTEASYKVIKVLKK